MVQTINEETIVVNALSNFFYILDSLSLKMHLKNIFCALIRKRNIVKYIDQIDSGEKIDSKHTYAKVNLISL